MYVYFNGRRIWLELSAADGGGNDSGGGDDKDLPANVVRSFERLLERNGNNANAVAQLLFNENRDLRDAKRQIEGKLPAEGSLILSGADAQTWTAYTALGKPDELKTHLEERTQLQGKLSSMERETTLRSVAETVGYKASVLANLDRMAKAEGKVLAFEVRDTTVDGKPAKVAYVKDGDKDFPLTEYAAQQWSDFLPSLTVQGTTTAQTQAAGTRFIAQHAGSGAGGKVDPVADFILRQEEARAKVKNPLLRE
jgi:hypothetical protein